MAKERRAPDRTQNVPPPVERIELSERAPKRRLVLVVLLIIVMLVSFGYALTHLLRGPQGMSEISADSASGYTAAGELTFRYDLTGVSTADRKALTILYTQAAKDAFEIFHPLMHFDGRINLYDLSSSPETRLAIDPVLFDALSRCISAGSRHIYLAPVYRVLDDLFFSADHTEAAAFDPLTSAETAEFFRSAAAFANDPAHVGIELFDNGEACLHVSDEYKAFAEEYGITAYLDLYWMKNAFIVDQIAGVLAEHGYTKGLLTSHDGFTRCLDSSGNDYTMTLYYRKDGHLYTDTELHFAKPFASAAIYSYPLTDRGYADRYYTWRNGRVTSAFTDPADGMPKTALPELILISDSHTAGDLALCASQYFIADTADTEGISALLSQNIWSVRWEDGAMIRSGV